MLSRRDTENVFDRVGDKGLNWEYWHEDNGWNFWVSSSGEWLMQVSYTKAVIVLTRRVPDSDEQVGVLIPYDGTEKGTRLLAATTVKPNEAHDRLRDHDGTTVVCAEISVK